MNKKKKGLILSILAILSLIVITLGVTYAFFNYIKQGTTENTVTTGTITFLYTEVSGVGKGISIKDAYPVSDNVGKAQTGEGNVFDFKVTSNTPSNSSIPYEITARKKIVDNILDEEAVKIYLTKVSGTVEDEVLLDNYSNLDQTTNVDSSKYIEKTLYTDKVPADSSNYEQAYRLRMWVDDSIDFSPVKDENGKDIYPYNNKTFTVNVNVYANAKVVTEEDIENESKAEISSLTVDGNELTKVENKDYDYETSLPEGTTETTINVETISPNATVKVERIDSLAYKESSIKRLSVTKILELTEGNNYFKITVISENRKVENQYIIKIALKKLQAYNIGDAVTAIDGSKWHVLEYSSPDDEYVVLLSDYNLNTDGTYNTLCTSYRCSVRAFDPNNTSTYDVNDLNNIGYFMKNTYEPLVTKSLNGTIEVTLPEKSQIENANGIGTITSPSGSGLNRGNSPWLLTTNYWTKTANSSIDLGTVVGQDSYFSYTTANNNQLYGVRPVIKTSKFNLITE